MNTAIEIKGQNVLQNAQRVDAALTKVLEVMQQIDQREPKVMAALRQRYALPQTLAAVANTFGDLSFSLRDLFGELEKLQ